MTTNIVLIYIQFGKISYGSVGFEYDIIYIHKIQYKTQTGQTENQVACQTKINDHSVLNSTPQIINLKLK